MGGGVHLHEIAPIPLVRVGVVVDVFVPLVVVHADFSDAVPSDGQAQVGYSRVFRKLICALRNRLLFHLGVIFAVAAKILLEEERSVGTWLWTQVAAINH